MSGFWYNQRGFRKVALQQVKYFHTRVTRNLVKLSTASGRNEFGFPQSFQLPWLCEISTVLLGVLVDTWIEFYWNLHGSAGPCDGHILNGSLLHGRKRMCVCFPSLATLNLPLDPILLTLSPGNVRLIWIHLSPLSMVSVSEPRTPLYGMCAHSLWSPLTLLKLICSGLTFFGVPLNPSSVDLLRVCESQFETSEE
jgi:hypothetical protein